jgi:cytochrome c oxidase subunit II
MTEGGRLLVIVPVAVGAAGCGGPLLVLEPAGPAAHELARLWWALFWATIVPASGVIAWLLFAVWRGRQRNNPGDQTRPRPDQPGGPYDRAARREQLIILGIGACMPAIVLIVLLVLSIRTGQAVADAPVEPGLVIDVEGHQFWWHVRYPDHGVVTANELHVPVGVPVRLRVWSADVIHSFWVPQVHGKIDLLPGRINTFWIQADRPGVYRGFCAEFCGVQHALMQMLLVAEPQTDFEVWLAARRRPAPGPETAAAVRGREVFREAGCRACHVSEGEFPPGPAGNVGPDLTALASRRTLAAAVLPNTPGQLQEFIRNPNRFKPGVRMPAFDLLDEADLEALVEYLGTLR